MAEVKWGITIEQVIHRKTTIIIGAPTDIEACDIAEELVKELSNSNKISWTNTDVEYLLADVPEELPEYVK
jgi:hypothetical protein